ncbi:sugar phosphate isomerase/epimerase family protein [Saccharopolyspora hattusasensis]|uniref:sugar phosphate isomerase/epimerase family protein n=1 Tax=Saccharopolyspora hattusasensis TaxID=1128679 RepID=UPI003D9871BF
MTTVPTQPRPVGLAPLSLISTAPPDLVVVAAEAGFNFIGVRVRPVTEKERRFDLQPGSPMLTETLRRLRDTGLRVLDIEFLLMDGSGEDGHGQRDAWRRMLEAGEALGAATMTVAGADPDPERFGDTLARLAEDARGFGITPTLEPISYQRINSLPSAAAAARVASVGVVVDVLHFRRFGSTLDELSTMTELVAMLQLCDGPVQRPADREGLVREARANRLPPGEGDFRLAEIVAALPPALPVSVEAPSPGAVERLGELGWARRLKAAADRVLTDAAALNRNFTSPNGAAR